MFKRFLWLFGFSLLCSTLFAEQYQIKDVSFNVRGISRPEIIERNVKINYERVFDSEASLLEYINDYEQRLLNTRHFSSVNVDFSVDAPNDSGISYIHLLADVVDSSHFIFFPYPSYSSNTGFEVKARALDSNFLGFLNRASASLMYGYGARNENEDRKRHKFGFSFDYNHPFKAGIFDAVWQNDINFTYGIGDEHPEWKVRTGVIFTKPVVDDIDLKFGFFQYSYGNLDYKKFDDSIYFTEEGIVELPIKILESDKWNNVYYAPKAKFEFNWDFNGIASSNHDLAGPRIQLGHSLNTGRIDWTENNFRNGVTLKVEHMLGYNFSEDGGIFQDISLDLSAHKAYKYNGFSAKIYAFYNWRDIRKTEFGKMIRGIKDNQYFNFATTNYNGKAAKSRAAIIINLDAPIHLFSTDASKLREKLPENSKVKSALKILDLDFQFSPFFDMAIFYNEATGVAFNPKDGFYGAGIELIVHPIHWRNIQFRASFGFDVGRLWFGKLLNVDWRRDVSEYEITIGVGLHY